MNYPDKLADDNLAHMVELIGKNADAIDKLSTMNLRLLDLTENLNKRIMRIENLLRKQGLDI